MKDVSLVSALKTSTGLRSGLLTLLASGALACTEVNVEPVAIGGSAGGISNGGSSGTVGQGGSNPGNGGSSGTAGEGGSSGTAGEGGSSGTTANGGTGGTGGTSSGTGGTELPDAGDPGPINLVTNPGFETGLPPWTMIAQAGTIVRTTDCGVAWEEADAGVSDAGEPEYPRGLYCGRGTARTAIYHGPAYPLNSVLARGKTYSVSAYGRIANASSSVLKLTMRAICVDSQGIGLPILYSNLVPEVPVTDTEWLFLSGQDYTVPDTTVCPTMTDLRVYVEGPGSGIDILVDDLSIYEL